MRKTKNIQLHNTLVVIVDGKDEKWYIQKIKEHYPCQCLKKMSIKPELVQKKKVDDIFSFTKDKLDSEYNLAILILDMDNILKDNAELEKFKGYYQKYCDAKKNVLKGNSKTKYGWLENVLLITNTPCLEFWFLLHFKETDKFYHNFDDMKNDIKSIPALADYEKAESYYKNHPDIFLRLGGEDGIEKACANTKEFSLDCLEQGISGMNLMFDFFRELDKK